MRRPSAKADPGSPRPAEAERAPSAPPGFFARQVVKEAAASLVPRSWLVVHGPRSERRIALTFDDGPTELTRAYLEVLDRFDVRATFFVVGKFCAKRQLELQELARRGHTLGSHGYTHRMFPGLQTRDLLDELERTDRFLNLPLGAPRWVRPPHGAISPRSLFECARAGFSTVLWSYDSGDAFASTPSELLATVAARPPQPGDIILLHEDREPTLQALPFILESLLDAGYELVTLTALFEARP